VAELLYDWNIFLDRGIYSKLEKIEKELEILKNEHMGEKIYDYNTASLLKYHLDDKERNVVEYIRNNPGCNKQCVVEHFNVTQIPGLSRNPTFRIINDLIKRGILIEDKDRHNRNTHKLFLNERNIVLSVSKEIDDFRNIFLELLKNPSLANIQNDKDKKKILNYIDNFHSTFISVYIFRALPAFIKMIDYKQTLQELYNIIFINIILVQEEYSKFDNPLRTSHFADTPLSTNICTDDDDYDLKIEIFKNNGMADQIIPLLERLHRINYRYAKQDRILSKIY
jgi:hypothetical protein